MSFTDSDPFDGGPLDFLGVWIHDPADPQGTAQHFDFGPAGSTEAIRVQQIGHHYAGREYPVVDYGEHTDELVGVRVRALKPDHPATVELLREFARARTTLVMRDSWGRVIHGTMSDFMVQDGFAGHEVSFAFTRADVQVVTA